MCSAHRLKVLYIGVKLVKISQTLSRNYEVLTEAQMDTQNFGRYNITPHHFLWQGIKRSITLQVQIQ